MSGGKLSQRPWVVTLMATVLMVITVGTPIVAVTEVQVNQHVQQQTAEIQTLLTEIHILLTDGKSASAQNAKAAAVAARAGDVIITRVEHQLDDKAAARTPTFALIVKDLNVILAYDKAHH